MMAALRDRLDGLYNGKGRPARLFRYGLLAFDLLTVGFFVVTAMLPPTIPPPPLLAVEFTIAAALLGDFLARLWIADRKARYLLSPVTLADLVVIGTLLVPWLVHNLAFLRILRALRVLRGYHVLKDLGKVYRPVARNLAVIEAALNLFVFIFLVTALVYVFQVEVNPGIETYVDALYFTIATLTTTGFGDITLAGAAGRLLSVAIMVFGVALFLRLVQAIFRADKINYRCPDCGLSRHDPDAVHCKHCGRVIRIETEGA